MDTLYRMGGLLEDWRKAIFVLLYKGKGSRDDCDSYRA